MDNTLLPDYEAFAINRQPRKGRCKKPCFANGWHRVGTVPIISILDGGMPGYSAREICLECGKIFDNPRWFIPRCQPRELRNDNRRLEK